MGNQMKIMRVSDLMTSEELNKFIKIRLAENIIFLKKVDKIFKLGVCKLKTKQTRAEKIIKFIETDKENEFLFKFCLYSYLTEHLYAERTIFDDDKFFMKLKQIAIEFNIFLEEE